MAAKEVRVEERHLSLSEAATALDISERTAYRWIKSGKLRAYKPGRDYWIPESAVKEVVEESKVRPKAESRSSLEPSFEDALEGERREAIYDVVLNAARRQAEQDMKAANRTLASEGIQQPAYFKDHENEAIHRLLEHPADELAGALVELAGQFVRLEYELRRTAEAAPEDVAARSASA
jgi:excisionase family DNA binding protein